TNDALEYSGRREFLNASIVSIGNQDVSGVINRQAAREIELTVARALSTLKNANFRNWQAAGSTGSSSSRGSRNEIGILRNLVNGQLPILRRIKDLLEIRDIDFLLI